VFLYIHFGGYFRGPFSSNTFSHEKGFLAYTSFIYNSCELLTFSFDLKRQN